MTSRFLVRETCDSPEGMKLSFIGDAVEHANRMGSTYDQYVEHAGKVDYLSLGIPPERWIGRYSLILDDLNRPPDDTVIGGAFMMATQPEPQTYELHLVSAFMREEHRRKGLGSFVIGRPLGAAAATLPVSNLFVHNIDRVSADVLELMYKKGFRLTSDKNVADLRLPGRHIFPRTEFDTKALDAEILEKGWSGRYGNRTYRDGNLMGSIKRTGKWKHKLAIYDSQGSLLEKWDKSDINVDWDLSAAIWLLNRNRS